MKRKSDRAHLLLLEAIAQPEPGKQNRTSQYLSLNAALQLLSNYESPQSPEQLPI
jgi:hypothetical protein